MNSCTKRGLLLPNTDIHGEEEMVRMKNNFINYVVVDTRVIKDATDAKFVKGMFE